MRMLLESDHLVTAEEFARMQDGCYRWELVEGRVFRMSYPGMRHGAIAAHVAAFYGSTRFARAPVSPWARRAIG